MISDKSNQYDSLVVNIDELFELKKIPPRKLRNPLYKRILKRYGSAILLKLGVYEPLVESGFIRDWFLDFRTYWTEKLGGRPLFLNDFYFLLGHYRIRFQKVETPANADGDSFLESWTNSDTLYQLFGAVRRYSRIPLNGRSFEKWIKNGDSILEYGCGIAPITHSILNYGIKRPSSCTIADIRQINLDYASYRMGGAVNVLEITPYETPEFTIRYDAVFMITVMEHLPNPIETVEWITKVLNKGGIFIFDFIMGDGDGQDTQEAVDQRDLVLDFISENYVILQGTLEKNRDMGQTVCRKK